MFGMNSQIGSGPKPVSTVGASRRLTTHCRGEGSQASPWRSNNARKNADGFWYVDVKWGNGRKERLGPYKTEAAAQERIKAQLDAWHEGQKLFLKPPR